MRCDFQLELCALHPVLSKIVKQKQYVHYSTSAFLLSCKPEHRLQSTTSNGRNMEFSVTDKRGRLGLGILERHTDATGT